MAHAVGLLLSEYDDIDVVAEITEQADIQRGVAEHRPDLVLIDPEMPSLLLDKMVDSVSGAMPDASLVVMTTSSTGYVDTAVEAAAHGYVSLDTTADEVVRALRLIAAGQVTAIGPSIETLSDLVAVVSNGTSPGDDPLASLSPREKEVANLVAGGMSNREIADRMELSENTIKVHLRNVFQKTGVSSRNRLAAQIHASNN
ncbi:MAG: response regulator transcription factor [Chloroflexi bacterium]|nr:response regulator transcription factor [Chloroflexota bacterium]